ncbi:MAG: hypothetical protein J1E05_01615 [Eubacterium sp.]|nr:hypothetical protein [Eubacterium sp.]
MPTFSSSEIEEAKRRVREMQSRADSYVSGGKAQEKENIPNPHKENIKKQNETEMPVRNEDSSSDDSFMTILLLLIILSHEGADNKLLLALLYLLL